jgi:hypothetical protein
LRKKPIQMLNQLKQHVKVHHWKKRWLQILNLNQVFQHPFLLLVFVESFFLLHLKMSRYASSWKKHFFLIHSTSRMMNLNQIIRMKKNVNYQSGWRKRLHHQ